jgi:hypothetical protein
VKHDADDAADLEPAGELVWHLVGKCTVDPAHVGQDLDDLVHRTAGRVVEITPP